MKNRFKRQEHNEVVEIIDALLPTNQGMTQSSRAIFEERIAQLQAISNISENMRMAITSLAEAWVISKEIDLLVEINSKELDYKIQKVKLLSPATEKILSQLLDSANSLLVKILSIDSEVATSSENEAKNHLIALLNAYINKIENIYLGFISI